MKRPRVWVVAYRNDWSYERTARAIERHLSDRFEIRIAYTDEIMNGEIERWDFDLLVDLWWHGTLHDLYGRRVVKQVSSHRWRLMKWGGLKPQRMLQLFADDVGCIVVPSKRLHAELWAVEAPRDRAIMVAPKGFEPELFEDHELRGGELAIGWAGCAEASDKHVDYLLEAEPSIRLADGPGCLTYREMGDFYNSIDVIAIASSAEGDPRPLIEGMACGCFPVSTDVGIVPELVEHGVNGLIIPTEYRSADAFRQAFAWCRENAAYVRQAGRRNAEMMRRIRTWAHVMPAWGDAFDVALIRSKEQARGSEPEPASSPDAPP